MHPLKVMNRQQLVKFEEKFFPIEAQIQLGIEINDSFAAFLAQEKDAQEYSAYILECNLIEEENEREHQYSLEMEASRYESCEMIDDEPYDFHYHGYFDD